ncbi:uncharacterized protein LOC34617841 [Cyclospora cayetanensis]|uniref:Uncharacterized protein LOC34617841 n=1 Tax=Cyclospora cayetanensis TaxID=88456 RepID=A0A6P6RSQ4_9EIME|nr:uncharacterized protein LOC34617841 [Cyclospora cayetanensis]
MIPPEQLEYYMTEWVAASLEAIIAYRLFPCLGSQSPRRVNVITPTHIPDEHSVPGVPVEGRSGLLLWDATPDDIGYNEDASCWPHSGKTRSAFQFSRGFTPESVRHFGIEIPQVETLRAALLSEPKFGMRFPWQLRIVIVLHLQSPHVSGSRPAGGSAASAVNSSLGRCTETEESEMHMNCSRKDCGNQNLHGHSRDTASVCGAKEAAELQAMDPSLIFGFRAAGGQTRYLLEQWVLSFQPLAMADQQIKFEHRTLCTGLKGLLAAIHFLPSHSALLALANAEKPCRGQSERTVSSLKQRAFLESHIFARWKAHHPRARHERAAASSWKPLASYKSDLEDSLACMRFETLARLAENATESSPATRCRVQTSPRGSVRPQPSAVSRQELKQAAFFQESSTVSRQPSLYETGSGGLGAASGDAFLDQLSLKSAVPPKTLPKSLGAPEAESGGGPSLPDPSCWSSAWGFCSLASVSHLDSLETRTVCIVGTGVGSVECTVTYNEELAQSIVAAGELEAIDGSLADFHPVAPSCMQSSPREGPQEESSALSDSDPWLEMEDLAAFAGSSLASRSLRQEKSQAEQVGADLELNASAKRARVAQGRVASNYVSGSPERRTNVWHSFMRGPSRGHACRFASTRVGETGQGYPLERKCLRTFLQLPRDAFDGAFIAAAAAASGQGAKEERNASSFMQVSSPPSQAFQTDTTSLRAPPEEVSIQLGGDEGELLPEREEELMNALKLEEDILLDDTEFGCMWLNSASNFCLQQRRRPSPNATVTSSPCSPHLRSNTYSAAAAPKEADARRQRGFWDASAFQNHLDVALASKESASILEDVKHLTRVLLALERAACEMLRTADASVSAPRIHAGDTGEDVSFLLAQLEAIDTDLKPSVAAAVLCPWSSFESECTPHARHALWQKLSRCAALVGAQREEAKALKELTLHEFSLAGISGDANATDEGGASSLLPQEGAHTKRIRRLQSEFEMRARAFEQQPTTKQCQRAAKEMPEKEPTTLRKPLRHCHLVGEKNRVSLARRDAHFGLLPFIVLPLS